MNIVCETPRLLLTQLNEDDAVFVLHLMNTPDWLNYIGDRNIRTVSDARRYIASGAMTSYRQRGYGAWLIRKKEDGNPIGLCGLFVRDFLRVPDLGFALIPEAMGFRYAHEASTAVVRLSFENFGLPRLAAITSPENTRSIRLLESLGFQFQEEMNQAGNRLFCFMLDREAAGKSKEEGQNIESH